MQITEDYLNQYQSEEKIDQYPSKAVVARISQDIPLSYLKLHKHVLEFGQSYNFYNLITDAQLHRKTPYCTVFTNLRITQQQFSDLGVFWCFLDTNQISFTMQPT
ncbi:Hypothetical_protein [Hexamita inflata]|uniref:Hypothetical_protein n=1 Tax=Hexamita inflata TaxID=28002 RepID=A0AA86PMZ7_9EUKA|nr:Hypothetical protein HINF_LOCUS29233 [Hexamita inflata]